MALGMLCAVGFGDLGFLLLDFFLMILLGRLSLQWLETTRLFRPLEGLPTFLQLWSWWAKRCIPSNLLCLMTVASVDALAIMVELGQTDSNRCGTSQFAFITGMTIFIPLAWNLLYLLLPLIDYIALKISHRLTSKQIMVNCFYAWLIAYAYIAAPALTRYQCSLLPK